MSKGRNEYPALSASYPSEDDTLTDYFLAYDFSPPPSSASSFPGPEDFEPTLKTDSAPPYITY